ncbi:MAG TPA: hypothetical protein VL859_05575 [Flavobacterium sp.]|nr:hypothetical protein [Flavobacterium sp.]
MVADDRTVEWSPAFLRDDWNSRTEQSERLERDRLIARDFLRNFCFGIDFQINFIHSFWIIIM